MTRVHIRGKQDGQSQRDRSEDVILLALKMKEKATSQGIQAASRN